MTPAVVTRLCLSGAQGCSIFEPCPACRESFAAAVLSPSLVEADVTSEDQVVAFLDAYARLRNEFAKMVRKAAEEDARLAAEPPASRPRVVDEVHENEGGPRRPSGSERTSKEKTTDKEKETGT